MGGANESKLSAPPELNPDELCQYPKGKDCYSHHLPDSEAQIYYSKTGLASKDVFPAITVPELLSRAAKKYKASPALRVERPLPPLEELKTEVKKDRDTWKTWTFGQYETEVRQAAKSLMALGFVTHDAAGIFGFNSPEWVIAQMAAIYAGGKAAGIYPTDTPEQAKYKLDHANASVIFIDGQRNFDKIKAVVHKLEYLSAIVTWGELNDQDYTPLMNKLSKPVLVLSFEDFLQHSTKSHVKVSEAELDKRIAGIRPGHCCCLIYTSGTTGNPKAVMLSHDNCIFESFLVTVNNVDDWGKDSNASERFLSYLPLSHVAGMMVDIISPIVSTVFNDSYATTYFARPYDLKSGHLGETLQTVRPTMFLGVPRIYEKFADKLESVIDNLTGAKRYLTLWAMRQGYSYVNSLNYNKRNPITHIGKSYSYQIADRLVLSKVREKLGLDQVKFCFSGAAPLQMETQKYLANFGLQINEIYGMSEGTGGTTWQKNCTHVWGTVGYPLTTVEVKVYGGDPMNVNDKHEVTYAEDIFKPQEHEQGEICSRGRGIMMGYMANPRLGEEHIEDILKKNSEAIDKDGFLHSADKGTMDHLGFVKITGRFKELIIGAGGENIAPVPIENDIKKRCPFISNCIMEGDKRKFNVVLVTLKAIGATGETPGTNKLDKAFFKHLSSSSSLETIENALDNEDVIKAVEAAIKETNKNEDVVVSNACTIQKFMILPRDVSINSGELTATLKLKRGVVSDKFKPVIDELFKDSNKGNYVRFPESKFAELYGEFE